MKKIILTIALMAAAATAAFAQLSVGAGYVGNSFDNELVTFKGTNGAYAGADYTLKLGSLGVTPGVYFVYQGNSESGSEDGISYKQSLSESYIYIPVNVSYGIDLGVVRAFVFAGPTFNLGLSSQYKVGAAGINIDPINLYDKDSEYGRFNVLLGGGVGIVALNNLRVTLGYNYGLIDRAKSEKVALHNSGVHIGAAWMF